MKLLGTVLLLAGGLWVRQDLLRRCRWRIAVGEELLAVLQTLDRGVYTLRRPLAELMGQCCRESRLTAAVWEAVAWEMAGGALFARAWETGRKALPSPYGTLLAPLGQTLPVGEGRELLHQVREDVYQAVGQARRDSGERGKLITALCLSASALIAVVLL